MPDSLTDIEQIEQRRPTNREIDAIYILTPEPYVVDCVVADLDRRRYRGVSVLWTSREQFRRNKKEFTLITRQFYPYL